MIEKVQDDHYGLSPHQAPRILKGDNLFLTACPGSGKTRSLAARAASLHNGGKRLALLSHTKVGADEIGNAVRNEHGIRLEPDSFVGTLHSFLYRFVLRPFGHLVTSAHGPMQIDPDAVRAMQPTGMHMDDYAFTLDGSITTLRKKADASEIKLREVQEFKLRAAGQGVVNYNDALYWTWRVLSEYKWVSRAIGLRFDEIAVDEAQDCTPLQLENLDALREFLPSIVLVGDFDQSIYGFAGAEPSACERFAAGWGLEARRLNENWRSSQLLCDVSARFRRETSPDRAVGSNRSLPFPPAIAMYSTSDVAGLSRRLETHVERAGITAQTAVVLARSKKLAEALGRLRHADVHDDVQALLAGRDAVIGPHFQAVRGLEKLLVRQIAVADESMRDGIEATALRSAAMSLAAEIPEPSGRLEDWVRGVWSLVEGACRRALGSRDYQIGDPPLSGALQNREASSLFGNLSESIRVETVHGVKGESVDAVMLVAEEPDQDWMTPQATTWASLLASSGEPTEEIRIFYVALTRAAKIFMLALPESTPSHVVNRYLEAGFIVDDGDS